MPSSTTRGAAGSSPATTRSQTEANAKCTMMKMEHAISTTKFLLTLPLESAGDEMAGRGGGGGGEVRRIPARNGSGGSSHSRAGSGSLLLGSSGRTSHSRAGSRARSGGLRSLASQNRGSRHHDLDDTLSTLGSLCDLRMGDSDSSESESEEEDESSSSESSEDPADHKKAHQHKEDLSCSERLKISFHKIVEQDICGRDIAIALPSMQNALGRASSSHGVKHSLGGSNHNQLKKHGFSSLSSPNMPSRTSGAGAGASVQLHNFRHAVPATSPNSQMPKSRSLSPGPNARRVPALETKGSLRPSGSSSVSLSAHANANATTDRRTPGRSTSLSLSRRTESGLTTSSSSSSVSLFPRPNSKSNLRRGKSLDDDCGIHRSRKHSPVRFPMRRAMSVENSNPFQRTSSQRSLSSSDRFKSRPSEASLTSLLGTAGENEAGHRPPTLLDNSSSRREGRGSRRSLSPKLPLSAPTSVRRTATHPEDKNSISSSQHKQQQGQAQRRRSPRLLTPPPPRVASLGSFPYHSSAKANNSTSLTSKSAHVNAQWTSTRSGKAPGPTPATAAATRLHQQLLPQSNFFAKKNSSSLVDDDDDDVSTVNNDDDDTFAGNVADLDESIRSHNALDLVRDLTRRSQERGSVSQKTASPVPSLLLLGKRASPKTETMPNPAASPPPPPLPARATSLGRAVANTAGMLDASNQFLFTQSLKKPSKLTRNKSMDSSVFGAACRRTSSSNHSIATTKTNQRCSTTSLKERQDKRRNPDKSNDTTKQKSSSRRSSPASQSGGLALLASLSRSAASNKNPEDDEVSTTSLAKMMDNSIASHGSSVRMDRSCRSHHSQPQQHSDGMKLSSPGLQLHCFQKIPI